MLGNSHEIIPINPHKAQMLVFGEPVEPCARFLYVISIELNGGVKRLMYKIFLKSNGFKEMKVSVLHEGA